MECLNGTGSSSALRRALFPQGFAGEVMRLVLETWQKDVAEIFPPSRSAVGEGYHCCFS